MIKSEIIATGAGIPKKTVTNFDLEKIVDTSDEWIYTRTGIKERHVVMDETGATLAAEAAKEAIGKAGIDPKEIDMIVVSTCSPDYLTPTVGCMVQKEIGAVNASCMDVSAACAGFIFAVSVADKYIRASAAKTVLVIASEVLSKFTNWEDRTTCVLFGDAAGAVIMRASEDRGIIKEELGSKGEDWEVLGNGKLPTANCFNGMPKFTQDDTSIFMDGREVFKFATTKLKESICNVVESAGLTMDDIKFFVPHQANTRIIEVVAKKLKVDMDKFYMNIERYGNTSSASIPVALKEMDDNGLLNKGDKIILSGFGGGLSWGTILVEW